MSKEEEYRERERLQHIHEVEQRQQQFIDTMVPFWFNLYQRCTLEGFDSNQSMEVLLQYIDTSFPRN